MDLQAISDANNAHKYIMGYNFKMEDDMATHKRVEELIARLSGAGHINAQDVYRIAHAALQGRSTSTFEACHLLLGEPVVQFSRDNVWVQTSRPEGWTLAVPRNEEAEAVENPTDYAELRHDHMPALLKHYSTLQKQHPPGGSGVELPVEGCEHRVMVHWDKLTFFDFVAGIRMTRRDNTMEFLPRSKPAIVGHRNYSPDTQPEDFYYAKLLLHVVWKVPGDWLLDEDEGSHVKAFHRLLRDDAISFASECYPNFNGSLCIARELFKVQAEMYLRGQMEGNEAQEHYKGALDIIDQLRRKCGDAIEMDVPDNVDTTTANIAFGEVAGGQQAFETLTDPLKQNDEIMSRQSKVMQLIIDSVLRSASDPQSPKLRLLIHGPGGSGKSFVLRAAAHAVRQAQRGVIIAAYTGAAAYQAGGVTLHSCLGLPVVNKSYGQHESDVPPPHGARLQQLKDLWRPVSLLIIDEMSLVSTKLLSRIELHLRHVKSHGSHLPFGGLNVVMIGDFYQLPPVLDHPMFYDMNLFKQFKLFELVGNHRAAGDPEWAALLGRVRKANHTEEDMRALNSRVKKAVNPKAVRLHPTRAGVANTNQHMLDYHLKNVEMQEIYECPAHDIYDGKLGMEPSPPSNAYANAEDLERATLDTTSAPFHFSQLRSTPPEERCLTRHNLMKCIFSSLSSCP